MSKFCGSCGAARGAGKFCSSCGQPYADRPSAPAPAAPAPAAAAPADPAGSSGATDDTRVEEVLRAPEPAPRQVEQTIIRASSAAESPSNHPADHPADPASPPRSAPPAYAPPPTHAPPPPYAPAAAAAGAHAGPASDWTQQHWTPQAAPQGGAPRQPVQAQNPFRAVPVVDYVRDVAAVVCLFAALGVTWDAQNRGGDHWWVVLSVLVAALAVGLPYLSASRVVPALGAHESALLKLVLGAPVVVCALVTLVNELVEFGNPRDGGIGIGVGLALAGTVLAVQPRASEAEVGAGLWAFVAQALAVLVVVGGLVVYVAHVVDDVTEQNLLFDDPLVFVSQTLTAPVLLCVLLGVPLVQLLGGSETGRKVFVAAAFGVLGGAFLSQANDQQSFVMALPFEKWNSPTGGTFLVGAAAAAVSGYALARRTQDRSSGTHPAMVWAKTASSSLIVSAAVLVISAVALVLNMLVIEDVVAAGVVGAVLLVAAAVLLAACVPMIADPRTGRPLVLGLIAAALVAGLIAASVIRAQEVLGVLALSMSPFVPSAWAAVTAYTFTAMFVLPLLAAFALTVPKPIRDALGPVYTPRQPAAAGAPTQPPPGHQPPPQPPQHPPY